MPELPEVESVRLGLVEAALRAPIVAVWRSPLPLRIGKAWRKRDENLDALVGRTPARIDRRGKYLLWQMAGDDRLTLLLHLGMTGRCTIDAATDPVAAHTHLRIRFADGRELRFIDSRRFGGLKVARRTQLFASEPLKSLGPEPLHESFSGRDLMSGLGNSRRVIRDALLDQHAVAGIGNIYAIEGLFVARIHPLARACQLSTRQWNRLAAALKHVLADALANGGTTLRDFRDLTGERGGYQLKLRVYGRAGEPCTECGRKLVGFVSQGRSGVYCPRHQRNPRGASRCDELG